MQEAVNGRQMMGLQEFMSERESIYTKSWSITPWSVLGWGLRQLGVLGSASNKVPAGKLVMIENLEEAGKEFAKRVEGLTPRTERVWTRSSFASEFRDLLSVAPNPSSEQGKARALSDEDLQILLKFLDRDKGLVVYDKETVKLITPGEERRVTQEDTTIAHLRSLLASLNTQIPVLESRIQGLTIQAKQAVEKKNRISALAALRSKKLVEKTLLERNETLARLEEVWSGIERAVGMGEVVRVMEDSVGVLEGLNREIGGTERVDKVMGRLGEEMGVVEEVGGVIAEGVGGVDEGEVDEELEDMERVEREKVEKAERDAKEEKERKEAEETRRKLDALEEVERKARDNREAAETNKESTAEQKAAVEAERGLEESMEGLKRMSLDPEQQAA